MSRSFVSANFNSIPASELKYQEERCLIAFLLYCPSKTCFEILYLLKIASLVIWIIFLMNYIYLYFFLFSWKTKQNISFVGIGTTVQYRQVSQVTMKIYVTKNLQVSLLKSQVCHIRIKITSRFNLQISYYFKKIIKIFYMFLEKLIFSISPFCIMKICRVY